MMGKKDFVYSACILALVAVSAYLYVSMPKIAYVRALDMFERYEAMKEASAVYKTKHERWTQLTDSLRNRLDFQLNLYNNQKAAMSETEQQKQEAYLASLQNDYLQQAKQLEEKALQEDQRMTASVLERINQFVDQYGKEHGYTLIFATTAEGEMIYGDSSIDITDEIVDALNNAYKGE